MTFLYREVLTPFAEIGQMLKAGREDMQISIQQASQALHIRSVYLQALEDGKFELLPGAAYTKGYLQAYATLLQLDKDEIVRRFEQVENPTAKRSYYLPQVLRQEKKPNESIIIGSVLAALGIIVVWLLVMNPPKISVSSVDAPPQTVAWKPAENASCFRAQNTVYPPCYWQLQLGLLPLRPKVSVMELAR